MTGETNLQKLIKGMTPRINRGEYVFVTVSDLDMIDRGETVGEFKEAEGVTIIIKKDKADELGLTYDFIVSWITLEIHSSPEAVGLTASFSTALASQNISCNVIAGYYHDHIFVPKQDESKAIATLKTLSEKG